MEEQKRRDKQPLKFYSDGGNLRVELTELPEGWTPKGKVLEYLNFDLIWHDASPSCKFVFQPRKESVDMIYMEIENYQDKYKEKGQTLKVTQYKSKKNKAQKSSRDTCNMSHVVPLQQEPILAVSPRSPLKRPHGDHSPQKTPSASGDFQNIDSNITSVQPPRENNVSEGDISKTTTKSQITLNGYHCCDAKRCKTAASTMGADIICPQTTHVLSAPPNKSDRHCNVAYNNTLPTAARRQFHPSLFNPVWAQRVQKTMPATPQRARGPQYSSRSVACNPQPLIPPVVPETPLDKQMRWGDKLLMAVARMMTCKDDVMELGINLDVDHYDVERIINDQRTTKMCAFTVLTTFDGTYHGEEVKHQKLRAALSWLGKATAIHNLGI